MSSPEVAVLKQIWDSVDRRTEGLAEGLKRRLVRTAIAPAVAMANGELILKYHEFLTRVPSGRHSFAHGSEMISKTVYWVSVARIAGGGIEEVPEIPPENHMSFATLSKVLVPVQWENNLMPRYRRSANSPHFVLGEMPERNEGKFDTAFFGHHLFRIRRGDFYWATTVEIAVGNDSVGMWLRERKSAQTFNMLMRR